MEFQWPLTGDLLVADDWRRFIGKVGVGHPITAIAATFAEPFAEVMSMLLIFLTIRRCAFGSFVKINVSIFTKSFLQQRLQQRNPSLPLQKTATIFGNK